MYGTVLGDVIGSRFEFDRGDKTKEFELFTNWNYFTDDTVMTVAVTEGLLNSIKKQTKDNIKKEIINSMKKWAKLYPNAGYGAKFYWWVLSDETKPYGSFGNGSAMRVSSVGWLYNSLEKTRNVARWSAEISHNHPEGIKGADCTASVIYLARKGYNKEQIRDFVENNFDYNLNESLESMRNRHKHIETCMDSLPKALKSFFEGNSYEDVIRNAISLGGDTDTLAAIAGAMAEAMYGIPKNIIEKGKNYLDKEMIEVLDKIKK